MAVDPNCKNLLSAVRILVREGKGDKDRMVPLSDPARVAIASWLHVRADAIGDGLAGAPDDFAVEAALDTQVVRAAAPGARIIVYGMSRFESLATGIDAIVADGRASIVSLSYGKCLLPGEYILQDEVDAGTLSFAAAAAAGVSIFASSGDTGAFTCHMFDPAEHRPASIPGPRPATRARPQATATTTNSEQ